MDRPTIVIPTFFANQMLTNCVQSICEQVTDAQILINKNTDGWLKACNASMASTNTDIILLNDDTIIISDIVDAMQTLAYSDEKIGIVGGKSLHPENRTILNYGIYVAPDGNTAHRYFGQVKDSVSIEKQRAIEGSCMYIKRALIDRIGLFDEKYTMGYRAEVAYCFKARLAGWKIVSTPDAEYLHLTSQTSGPLGIENDTYDIFMKEWGNKLLLGEV